MRGPDLSTVIPTPEHRIDVSTVLDRARTRSRVRRAAAGLALASVLSIVIPLTLTTSGTQGAQLAPAAPEEQLGGSLLRLGPPWEPDRRVRTLASNAFGTDLVRYVWAYTRQSPSGARSTLSMTAVVGFRAGAAPVTPAPLATWNDLRSDPVTLTSDSGSQNGLSAATWRPVPDIDVTVDGTGITLDELRDAVRTAVVDTAALRADAALVAPPRVAPTNASGQAYGPLGAGSPSADDELDLVAVQATNGKRGYARNSDLNPPLPRNPAEALSQQEARNGARITIPVYKSDGTTQIGVFEMG